MKMLCILMLAASLQISARGYSQGISVTLKNEPLEKLFTAVEQQTNFSFVYSKEAMQLSKPVTIDVKNETLENILKLGFINQSLTYSIVEKFIIVKIADKKTDAAVLYHDVSGRVVNENGEGVVATITEKGTANAVSTDADGYFQLKDVNENAILIVTGVGIEAMEIKVAGKSNVSISVKTKITGLTEVIINKGYYSTSQKLNTGNVSKITGETISKQPISNPLQALQGRAPGLYIQQNTGVPGGGYTLRLRGLNTIRSNGNDPLYIVDGVPYTSTSLHSTSVASSAGSSNPLNSINPSQIESIEILKDADATAIYGSRGANGVILITTKKGIAGKTNVSVNMYSGFCKVTRMLNMMGLSQYLQMRHEAFKNDNAIPDPAVDYDLLSWDTTSYTDWQKEMIGKTSYINDMQLSISGGNSNTQFLIGAGYHTQTTVFPGDFSDKKISGYFNLRHTSGNQKFKAALIGSYTSGNSDLPNQDLTGASVYLAPNTPPLFDAAAKKLNWPVGIVFFNPFSYLLQNYKSNVDNLISNATLSYNLMPNLKVQTSFGFTKMQMDELQTSPLTSLNTAIGYTSANTTLRIANSSIKTWIIEPQISWFKYLGKGRLDVLIGSTFQEDNKKSLTLSGTGFSSDALIQNIAAATTVRTLANTIILYKYNAIFGRLGYNWKDKYLINLTARRDGSSRFGPGKQFGNFGSIGSGWIFSNEKIFEKRFRFLSYGKLRVSYGITGNDRIDDYGYLEIWGPSTYPYQGASGLQPNRLSNPDEAWETTKKLEFGIDLSLLNDRIQLSSSQYRNRSSNILVPYPLPGITGFTSIPFFNLPATVRNTGWEFEVHTKNVTNGEFKWTSSFNLTIPRNKLLEYPNLAVSAYANIYVEGKSLFVKKLFHYTGVDRQTGVYTFEDVDNDGKITIPSDFQGIKEITQSFFGGFQNSLSYKNFYLDLLLQFVKQTGVDLSTGIGVPGFLGNQPIFVLDRWQATGDITNIQRFTQDYNSLAYDASVRLTYADNSIGDASFVRLKNVSLSYRFPAKLKGKSAFENFRIYTQCQNLFTITNYKGFDPENQSLTSLPPLRVITFGIQLTF